MFGRCPRGSPFSCLRALLLALLAFTWAERASFAQPIPKPPPMDFHPKPDSTVWVLGSLDLLGFGGGRLGALFVGYGGEGHVWITPNFGVGARVTAYAAGAPDSGVSSGLLFAGMLSARTKVIERTRQSAWLVGSLGGGAIGLKGYAGHSRQDQPFDEHAGFVTARVGFAGEYGPFAYGFALEAIVVPGKGGAGAPLLFAGFAF